MIPAIRGILIPVLSTSTYRTFFSRTQRIFVRQYWNADHDQEKNGNQHNLFHGSLPSFENQFPLTLSVCILHELSDVQVARQATFLLRYRHRHQINRFRILTKVIVFNVCLHHPLFPPLLLLSKIKFLRIQTCLNQDLRSLCPGQIAHLLRINSRKYQYVVRFKFSAVVHLFCPLMRMISLLPSHPCNLPRWQTRRILPATIPYNPVPCCNLSCGTSYCLILRVNRSLP